MDSDKAILSEAQSAVDATNEQLKAAGSKQKLLLCEDPYINNAKDIASLLWPYLSALPLSAYPPVFGGNAMPEVYHCICIKCGKHYTTHSHNKQTLCRDCYIAMYKTPVKTHKQVARDFTGAVIGDRPKDILHLSTAEAVPIPEDGQLADHLDQSGPKVTETPPSPEPNSADGQQADRLDDYHIWSFENHADAYLALKAIKEDIQGSQLVWLL